MRTPLIVITGANSGIGKATALALAKKGNRIVLVCRSEARGLAAQQEVIKESGNQQVFLELCDLASHASIKACSLVMHQKYKAIDILINNASAINLSPTEHLSMKRYDLMHSVNARGTFLATKLCLPHLRKGNNPHVLNLSPPLNLDPKWFGNHVAYTMAKYGMSMCVLGHAEEFKDYGIGVNALWPRTTIDTAAVRNLLGGVEMAEQSRKPSIIADSAAYILSRDAKTCTGNFFMDDEVMAEEGILNLDHYAVNLEKDLMPDFFV